MAAAACLFLAASAFIPIGKIAFILAGAIPETLAALTIGGKYLGAIPMAKPPPYHKDSSAVTLGNVANDTGGWLYNNVRGDVKLGQVFVNCTHTDSKGTLWTSY